MASARTVDEPTSLERRFGIAGIEPSIFAEPNTLGTGIDSLDEALEGGLHTCMLTEIAVSSASSGGQSLLLHLLGGIREEQKFAALVDGADCFDPQTAPSALLEHLLWARCRAAAEAMKVADLLLRDENLGMALVDLRWCDDRQIRRIKSADWYRLQHLAEQSGAYVCVFTPRPMIPSAQARVVLNGSLSLDWMESSLPEIASRLSFEVLRLRKRRREDFPNLIQRKVAEG